MRLFLFVMPGAGGRTGEEQPSHMGSWRMRMRSRSTAGGSRFDSCAALHFIPERVKTTDIRYKDPRTRCTKCGKLLPAGRKRLCYECRPNKRYKTAVVSPPGAAEAPVYLGGAGRTGGSPGAYLWAAGESGEQRFAFAAASAFGAMAVGQPSPGRRTNLTKGRHYNG